ncbi:putative protein MSS51 homolog, mitochondrial [Onthophagus taurus]|uniref:putative protein MSS51 homolog, mitochondrial n=1 Tax=Onthophagus taurus TaxID=166361 RepID=UPI0039BE02BC
MFSKSGLYCDSPGKYSLVTKEVDRNNVKIFYNQACLICLKASPTIKRCSKCKIAAYCSHEHQCFDWRSFHKPFCRIIRKCKIKLEDFKGNFEDFCNFKVALQIAWKTDLNRELYVHEEMMTLHPRVCSVCFTTKDLYCCEKCLNVCYCSKEHEEEDYKKHNKYCNELRLGLITDQYLRTRDITYVEFEPVDNNELKCCKDIQKHLQTSVHEVLYDYLTLEEKGEALQIAKTLCVVLGLNILHALKVTKTIKSDLIIHIVGADLNELLTDWLLATKIIRHWIPEIDGTIKYYFIGPAMLDQNIQQQNTNEDKIIIKYFGSKYHDIIDILEKPDIVFAFSCGLHEFAGLPEDQWKLSIPTLIHYEDVPVVLTSYTKNEMIKDKEILANAENNIEVIMDICENPFSSIKSCRDWNSKEPVFYMCKYMFIAKKKCKKDSETTLLI